MKLTRRALYDMVWSKPISAIAEEVGISDVGLAKICDRHRVPTPPRGYWAKVAAGQKVKKTLFTEAADPSVESVSIISGLDQLAEPVRATVIRQRADRMERRELIPKLAEPSPEEPAKEITELHTTVRRTAQTLRSKAARTEGVAKAVGEGECGIAIGVDSVQRCIRTLDLLARALEQRGLSLEPIGKKMQVVVGKERVEFELCEVTRWADYVPTAQDLAYDARRKREIERCYRTGIPRPDHLYGPTFPSVIQIRTGQLFISMDGYDGGLRHKWADGKKQTLEGIIPSIADGIELLIASRKAYREKCEEEARQRAERQRRQALADGRAKREQDRVAFTNELIERHAEIRRLQFWLLEASRSATEMPDSAYFRMVAWVSAKLDVLTASVSADDIEKQLIAKKFFPADGADEWHDPLGDPPPRTSYW